MFFILSKKSDFYGNLFLHVLWKFKKLTRIFSELYIYFSTRRFWCTFQFWISRLFLGRSETMFYFFIEYHKKRYLCSIKHFFTKLSHNVCLTNTHILTYLHVRCNCILWNVRYFCCVFFKNFHTSLPTIHVWSIVSSPNFHRLCVL